MINNNEEKTTRPPVSMHANPELHASLMEEENDTNSDADITEEELQLLDDASVEKDDDIEQVRATLDNTDDDGEELNEAIDVTGDDLDVPGAELDDANEAIGEEDEENNNYSHQKQHDE